MNSRESSWQKYPHYHRCDTSWLGILPNHWALRRLKSCAIDVADLTNHRNRDDVYVALEHVEGWTGKITEPDEEATFESQVKRFKAGDILFGKLRPYLAKVAQPKRDGVCVGEFLVLRPHAGVITSDYLERLTRSKPVINAIDASTFGAKMPRADWHFMGNMALPLPPLNEQAAIVRYLDHTDEIINRYISAKERLIALMREQRQAVIHQAVTRGLDPNVPLKPSGVSWLGDMPRHWESPRLRYMGNAIIGLTYDPQNVTDVGGGTLVFRASNIRDGRITYEDCVYVDSRVPSLLITRPGDILICSRSGSRALIGKNAKIDVNSAGNTFGAFMTVFRSETNDYLHYVFNSNMFEHQSAMFATSTVNQLTLGMINDMKTPFPPSHEQEMIVGYLDQATAKIDQAIIQTKRQIDLTNEYRTRLIADVVTGQIDVRNATIEVPGQHL